MGTEPGSRSSLDSSFRNRLHFVLEICLFPRKPTRFPLGGVRKVTPELGRLTYVNRRPWWSIVFNRGILCLVTQCLSGEKNGLDARIT